MDRLQLAHILRAACRVTGDLDVVVLGSQAILGFGNSSTSCLTALTIGSLREFAPGSTPRRPDSASVQGATASLANGG
jgi:hypothetical protein